MRKIMLRTLITTALFIVMVAVMPVFGSRVEAATKKPGEVKKIETVKVTKNSIQIQYSKSKGAKGYQISVYNGKEKVKSMEVKNTKCTVKGLEPNVQYTVKVCGYNGKVKGKKKSAKIYTANENGIVGMGRSTTTGKALEKEYNAWRDFVIKEAEKKYKTSNLPDFIGSVASATGILFGRRCTKEVTDFEGDLNKYDKKKVYETYKKGKGTNLELYHLILDIIKKSGRANYEIIADRNYIYMVSSTDRLKIRITPSFYSRGRWMPK